MPRAAEFLVVFLGYFALLLGLLLLPLGQALLWYGAFSLAWLLTSYVAFTNCQLVPSCGAQVYLAGIGGSCLA